MQEECNWIRCVTRDFYLKITQCFKVSTVSNSTHSTFTSGNTGHSLKQGNFLITSVLIFQIFRKYRVEYHYEDFRYKICPTYIPDNPLKFRLIERHEL
jgi:hypothetical protein